MMYADWKSSVPVPDMSGDELLERMYEIMDTGMKTQTDQVDPPKCSNVAPSMTASQRKQILNRVHIWCKRNKIPKSYTSVLEKMCLIGLPDGFSPGLADLYAYAHRRPIT